MGGLRLGVVAEFERGLVGVDLDTIDKRPSSRLRRVNAASIAGWVWRQDAWGLMETPPILKLRECVDNALGSGVRSREEPRSPSPARAPGTNNG